jgi:hypothetical protein
MGTSTNAVLVYGYNLGSNDSEWLVQETDEHGGLDTGWWGEDDEDDFATAATRRLLNASGFTETYEDGREGYFDREREAEKALAVKIASYCSDTSPIYTLAAHVITVHRGHLQVLDLPALQRMPADNGWDGRLAAGLRALGLTPLQVRAGWLLCSYWG